MVTVMNRENPSTPTAPAMVENGPRWASWTWRHSGTTATITPTARAQVTAVYGAVALRPTNVEISISTSAPPTRMRTGATAAQSTSGVAIGVGFTGSGWSGSAASRP